MSPEQSRKITPGNTELLVMLCLYLIGFTLLAINPHDRADWAMENLFPIAQLIAVIIAYRHFKFTRLAYHMIFIYLFVQSWGGHFTYAEAAPFNWLRDHFHLSRNHYDRVAHFMLGFLVAIPVREILMQVIQTSRRWLAFITASIILAIGAFYEFIEWWVVPRNLSPRFGVARIATRETFGTRNGTCFLLWLGQFVPWLFFSDFTTSS